MISAEIDPVQLRQLLLTFKKLRPQELMTHELLDFARSVGIRVGEYPPDFPGNTYVRTGLLGRSWDYRMLGDLAAEVGNYARYAGWVHGPQQVALHRAHGWRRLFEMGEEMFTEFITEILDKAAKLWTS